MTFIYKNYYASLISIDIHKEFDLNDLSFEAGARSAILDFMSDIFKTRIAPVCIDRYEIQDLVLNEMHLYFRVKDFVRAQFKGSYENDTLNTREELASYRKHTPLEDVPIFYNLRVKLNGNYIRRIRNMEFHFFFDTKVFIINTFDESFNTNWSDLEIELYSNDGNTKLGSIHSNITCYKSENTTHHYNVNTFEYTRNTP